MPAVTQQQPVPGATGVIWTPLERESFFAAIARHRRAGWRVTVVSMAANALLAMIVAALMSPLFYGVIALALDLANLFHPVPNPVPAVLARIDLAVDHPERVSIGLWARWLLLAALPGLAWMALVLAMLARVLRAAASVEAGQLRARVPNGSVLAEQRFANVIEEMALAAALSPPRVLIAEQPVVNAAIAGPNASLPIVVVSTRLLAQLSREQMQGVAAHLMASIANGDLRIGLRVALTQSLFAFIARISDLSANETGWRRLARMGLTLVNPQGAAAKRLTAEISDPFAPSERRAPERAAKSMDDSSSSSRPTWREWLSMPLYGPLVLSGLLAGIVAQYLLSSLLALVWRQRKYMADATAVKLTRDPDALAGALERMGDGLVLAPSLAHLSVVSGYHGLAPLGGVFVSMFPPLPKRLCALASVGAHVDTASIVGSSKLPWLFTVLGPAAAVAAMLVTALLVPMSVALTMIFTGAPFAVLHALLRVLGH